MKSNYFALIVAIAVSVWNCLGVTAPSATDFWVRDDAGRITHTCGGKEPLVMCMQGRKVVMQVESNSTEGLGYTARFYNLQRDLLNTKKILFEGGRESNPEVQVDNQPLKNEFPSSATFDGLLTFAYPETLGVVATRTIYPSMNKALVIEEWQVCNTTNKQVTVTVAPARRVNLVDENIAIVWNCQGVEATAVKPGGLFSFSTYVQAKLVAEPDIAVQVATERGARRALAEAAWRGPGRLETPDPSLDVAFALQKFHVLECPIETYKGIITHNGSLTYSPGIWANDPVEYSSPVFPFFGDAELNRAGMNMYRVWQDYCREKGIDPFPGSFEGPGLKLTQRERGDDAMVLYGLSKFLLFQGDRAAAEELWPLIEFSAESVLKHTSTDGIIASQTDEMEGRYPTGTANLSTSALAYGGYRQAAHLARALGKPAAAAFDTRADALRKAIESYFGAEIEGFETYRYYKENTTLRGWILLPLAMGITERENGTSAALLSDKLWPNRMEGADILAESTRPTEWGRETYYALRVLFKTGRTEEALDLTRRVVKAQVFGSKGPYPDEDAIDMLCPGSLYPRIFVEGVFGIVPTSFDSFECTPRLPEAWPRMALRDVRAFGRAWDLVVERAGDQQKITVSSGGQTVMTDVGPTGKTYSVTFAKQTKDSSDTIQKGEMAGYLLVPNEKVPESYNAGFSMYVAAWPLLDQYPGQRFQTGLFGTWMFARKDPAPPIKLYSDIEGGLGWWRDTEYATETPKFIMGGVAPNFSEWANGPGAGKGRDWDKPNGKYGVAQLSPWLLWPPDGLNLKQGTCGELFGYGYLPLPLTPAKTTTAGKDIPTGDQSWTLFLNTRNFKGPVAFFTPFFWSAGAVAEPHFSGMLLDSRPSDPNRALQMETQHVPSIQAVDAKGEAYARIAPTFFPCETNGESRLVHHITSYNKQALWDAVKTWFDGGAVASGTIQPAGAILHQFTGKGGATWRIYPDATPKEEKVPVAWTSFATPMAADPNTFGYRWDPKIVQQTESKNGSLVKLPEYYHLVKSGEKPQWVPVSAAEVPAETGLAEAHFDGPIGRRPKAYVTPDDAASCWKKPGPAAGPFQARLGDGSTVTYYWYRFADQPAILNADLTDTEREALQERVVKIHRSWKNDRDYLAPPAFGKLAELDPALIVTPPPGLEAGYVPIVTRQALAE